MGTDINTTIEWQVNGRWVLLEALSPHRLYDPFHFLGLYANPPAPAVAKFANRGTPADSPQYIDPATISYWDQDWNLSPSWCTINEAIDSLSETKDGEVFNYVMKLIVAWIAACRRVEADPTSTRLVYHFSN